jgi:GTP-binding protein
MFVDRIKIYAEAGKGGRGCVSFRREKFVPKGGPDGGDGGRGGDIVLKADLHVDNLSNLFYEPIVKAKSGGHGMGKKMAGRAGANKIVKVPVGTIVYSANADPKEEEEQEEKKNQQRPTSIQKALAAASDHVINDQEDQKRRTSDAEYRTPHGEGAAGSAEQSAIRAPQCEMDLLADLTHDGQEFLLARGGAGGKGNVHFKSSRNRAPREFTEGEEGEQGHFLLELRTIADAGLVGYPNAGKSTLLRKISAARPKVALYPFTTLHPIVGVVEFPEYRRATVADIPGLIEGAHRNVGLGHDFLRHITRCRLLLFVLDVAGSEGRNPIEDLQNLRREIDLYDRSLSQRPWFVIANKIDLPAAPENLEALRKRLPSIEIIPVSALKNQGIEELKNELGNRLNNSKQARNFEVQADTKTKVL